jgi:4-hydroxybenzoate polyprenyltransferase
MPPPLDIDIRIPLVVDLDGTLILTDTLYESFARLIFRDPVSAVQGLLLIAKGPAAVKRHFANCGIPGSEALPRRSDLIDLLKSERARGRSLHLVTAADQKTADEFAASFGVFDSARGSDGQKNLKGQGKLDYLAQHFADGFIYAGDHRADLPVFQAARGVILCDVDASTAAAVTASGTPVLAQFRRTPRTWRTWVRTFRIHQWSKNILVFVPLFTAHAFADRTKLYAAVLGFCLLCVIASATYMINDLADLSADREHRTKRYRPFASGALPIAVGLVAAPLMLLGALIAGYLLSPAVTVPLFLYLCLTIAYSFGLKQVPLLDVFVIAVLFTLRIVVGTEVIGLDYSPWLLSFSLAFFLSLALAKRHGEIMNAVHAEAGEIAGRGYTAEDWPLTLTFGIGVGLASIVIMLLYLTNDAAPSGFYSQPAWLYAIPAFMVLWLMRIWLLSNRTQLHDDPVVFALKDRVSLMLGVAVTVAFFLAF